MGIGDLYDAWNLHRRTPPGMPAASRRAFLSAVKSLGLEQGGRSFFSDRFSVLDCSTTGRLRIPNGCSECFWRHLLCCREYESRETVAPLPRETEAIYGRRVFKRLERQSAYNSVVYIVRLARWLVQWITSNTLVLTRL